MRTCRISQKYTIVSYMLKLSKRWWYWRYEASLMPMLWLLCWIHTFIEFHGLEISLLGETMIKSRTVHGRLYARSDTFRHHKYSQVRNVNWLWKPEGCHRIEVPLCYMESRSGHKTVGRARITSPVSSIRLEILSMVIGIVKGNS